MWRGQHNGHWEISRRLLEKEVFWPWSRSIGAPGAGFWRKRRGPSRGSSSSIPFICLQPVSNPRTGGCTWKSDLDYILRRSYRRDVSEHLTKELQHEGHFWPLNKLVGYVKKPIQWAAQGGEAAPCPWGPWGLKLTTYYEEAAGENSTNEGFIAKKKSNFVTHSLL